MLPGIRVEPYTEYTFVANGLIGVAFFDKHGNELGKVFGKDEKVKFTTPLLCHFIKDRLRLSYRTG